MNDGSRFDPFVAARVPAALGALGDAIRRCGEGPLASLLQLERMTWPVVTDELGADAADALVACGVLDRRGNEVQSDVGFIVAGDVVAAVPREQARTDLVYVGLDSLYLIQAALRLAPAGATAVDLGTGTGMLAAMLAQRYTTVVATDIVPRVVAAAAVTLAMNRYPSGHRVAGVVADVAAGLRADAYDLVVANAPWVPTTTEQPRIFADGGATGVELPRRFLLEGAELLRPGGVAITLALDPTMRDGRRPLAATCEELQARGFTTTMVATPLDLEHPGFVDRMRERQPAFADARHVAVVVARPHPDGAPRDALVVAARDLERRWRRR